jgi:phosphatidylglycerophosphatase A
MRLPAILTKATATFFGVGYLPFIPGTFGSLAGLGLYFCVKDNSLLYLFTILLVCLAGFASCGRAEELFGKKDPKYAVIDEVAGMLISLFLVPYAVRWVVIGFFVFRLLDTLKPFPASRFQNMRGSLGIMGDDIVAGLYCNIVLQLVLRFASCSFS